MSPHDLASNWQWYYLSYLMKTLDPIEISIKSETNCVKWMMGVPCMWCLYENFLPFRLGPI